MDGALPTLGWTGDHERAFAEHAALGYIPGRAIGAARDAVRARTVDGDLDVVVQRGFRREALTPADFPAVGDWLALERIDASAAALRAVLPRRSVFSRGDIDASRVHAGVPADRQVIAANVDTAIIVAALTRDLNLRRLERYLALAWSSGAAPVVLLNKADLCDDVPASVAEVGRIAGDAPIVVTTATTGTGLDQLAPWLAPGRTVCLLGSSGVGKSTITNALLGEERQLVREVREDDSRGRHTTTSRELFRLPGGALLIDTPGMRSMGMWGAEDGLDHAFDDIDRLAGQCRFSDCSHEVEPGCAVLAAIDSGELQPDRLRSRRKLQRELGLVAERADMAARRAADRRWGKVCKQAARAAQMKRGWS